MSNKPGKSFSGRRKERLAGPAEARPIEMLYAYLTTHDGEEAVVSGAHRNQIIPLLSSKRSDTKMLREMAMDVADGSKEPVRLVVFSRLRVMETIQPRPSQDGDGLAGLEEVIDDQAEVIERIGSMNLPESLRGGKINRGGMRIRIDGDFVLQQTPDGHSMGYPPEMAIQVGEALISRAAELQGRRAVVTYLDWTEAPDQ